MAELDQLIAGRQKRPPEDRKQNIPQQQPEQRSKKKQQQPRDIKTELIIKQKLREIQNRTGVPIEEVTTIQTANKGNSKDSKGGYINYQILATSAKANKLIDPNNSSFIALKSAYAEAIVYGGLRDARTEIQTPVGVVINDPVAKSKALATILPQPFQAIANRTLDSFKNKTPDMLVFASPQIYMRGKEERIIDPAWLNIVDPNNPTSTKTKPEIFYGKTLISPVEVTVTGDYDKIKEKVNKFKQYQNPFPNSSEYQYVPILVLDRDKFMELKPERRAKIVTGMANIGGRIELRKDLVSDATQKAQATAIEITKAVNLRPQSVAPNFNTTSQVAATNSTAQNTSQIPVTTATNTATQEISQTNLQATSSMGETAEVAQANNAKLQEILARMQTRDRSETSNNIPATTSEIGSITTTPNTATVNTTERDTAFLIPTSQNTALTGGRSTTALTGGISTTALGGTSTTALTGGKTQEPSLTPS